MPTPRRPYHRNSDPRFLDLGTYLSVVAAVQNAVAGDRSLSTHTVRVALYLCGLLRASESQQLRYAYPAAVTIADHLKIGERTVKRAIAELKTAGYFRIHRGSKRRGMANRYYPLRQQSKTTRKDASRERPAAAAPLQAPSSALPSKPEKPTPILFAEICQRLAIMPEELPGWAAMRSAQWRFEEVIVTLDRRTPFSREKVRAIWKNYVTETVESGLCDDPQTALDEMGLAEFNC